MGMRNKSANRTVRHLIQSDTSFQLANYIGLYDTLTGPYSLVSWADASQTIQTTKMMQRTHKNGARCSLVMIAKLFLIFASSFSTLVVICDEKVFKQVLISDTKTRKSKCKKGSF